ncbi:MAG: ABC transporter permease [Candidatus Bathyarchaeota archaeon]|nr:ABC transporter permease [Candidatus Bathyarchaeota archaeon]
MKIIDITVMSAEGLFERKGRVALNVLGILIGCAAVTGLISVADGMNNQVRDQLAVIGTNTLFVVPEEAEDAASTLSATQILNQEGISWRDREIIESTSGVTLISEISSGMGSFTVKGDSYDVTVLGVGDYFLDINQDVKMEEGRFFLRGDKAVVFIGRNIAYPSNKDEQVVAVGDRIKLEVRVKGEEKEITLRVVGILEEHGTMFGLNVDDAIAIPFRTYDQLYEQGGSCAIVQAYIEDTDRMAEVETELENGLGEDYFVVSPDAAIDVQKQVTGTIQAVLGGIAAISMFVAGIGIVNTMAISVSERTKEIGTMKAIGAKSTDILFMFLSEALYTGLIGGVVGSSVGFILGKLVGNFIGLPVEISLLLGFATVMFALITSLVSGASPAWRAAKMNPVEALRKE